MQLVYSRAPANWARHSTPNESVYSSSTAVTAFSILIPKLMVDHADTDISDSHSFSTELYDMSQFGLHNFAKRRHYTCIKPVVPNELMSCNKVWVRKPLEVPNIGSYR